jgi:hypothetical protein
VLALPVERLTARTVTEAGELRRLLARITAHGAAERCLTE